ncbi:NAD(P)-binding protein [Myriangium duriaei CBS 260.36]|uniref:NAD(P)-binding protein n=1 Tax=Myriangium duriaei CBS 260.36 TaxID=1168546 RepID=A0A9P4J6B4_9PEZI|nr:NAD(P)-binding protein [Myriangium duriaei CBS 260.36]
MAHNIVVLDQCFSTLPPLNFDCTVTHFTSSKPDQVSYRIKHATIVVTTDTRITRANILFAKNLRLVAANGTGTDIVDKAALIERGVAMCHVPAATTESVSEHALALYYGLRRKLREMHQATLQGRAWEARDGKSLRRQGFGQSPRVNRDETMVVIGYGHLGKGIAILGEALNMRVLIAERKDACQIRPGRVPFEQCLRQGTVFMIAAPLTEATHGMIGTPELTAMNSTALVVNVGRGSIIDDMALVDALRRDGIGGAAVDVYREEPATRANSLLLDPSIPNLLLSPHVGFVSQRTIETVRAAQKANLEAFVAGVMINTVVPPGKGWDGCCARKLDAQLDYTQPILGTNIMSINSG